MKTGSWMLFLIGLVPLIIFCNLVAKDVQSDTKTTSIAIQRVQNNLTNLSYDFKFIKNFVENLEDGNEYKAIELVLNIENTELSSDLRSFFNLFSEYYFTKKNKNRNFKPIINNIGTIKSICLTDTNNEYLATQYSEKILFWCMKKFEQNAKNKKCLVQYCNQYIEFIGQTQGYQSAELAAIMCLHVRAYYEEEGISKTNEKIKSVQELITKYQQRYPEIFGETPKDDYQENANYLKRFNDLCNSIRNKHFWDKWDRLHFDNKIELLEV